MKAGQPKPADELRMSSAEFDRIMGQVLQVKPEESKRAKRPKPKAKNKKAQKK